MFYFQIDIDFEELFPGKSNLLIQNYESFTTKAKLFLQSEVRDKLNKNDLYKYLEDATIKKGINKYPTIQEYIDTYLIRSSA